MEKEVGGVKISIETWFDKEENGGKIKASVDLEEDSLTADQVAMAIAELEDIKLHLLDLYHEMFDWRAKKF